MNCPSCGAPMQLKAGADTFRCEYCHAIYVPEKDDDGVRVLGEPTEQACPVCSVTLMQASIASFRIVYCTHCHGMLIPMGQFQVLIDELRSQQRDSVAQPAADDSDLHRTLHCPQCKGAMEAHLYAGPGNVMIDSCDNCSLNWLDHGELMHIAHAPDEHRTTSFLDSVPTYHDTRFLDSENDSFGWGGTRLDPQTTRTLEVVDIAGTIASLFVR